jgi:hypothetical protein
MGLQAPPGSARLKKMSAYQSDAAGKNTRIVRQMTAVRGALRLVVARAVLMASYDQFHAIFEVQFHFFQSHFQHQQL